MNNNYCNLHGKVRGRVQGVGYRAWFKKNADKLKIFGWVKSCSDKSVEFEIYADKVALDKLIEKCYQGPLFCKVEEIIITKKSKEEFTNFEIIY